MKLKIFLMAFIVMVGAAVLSSCNKFLSQVPDITLSDDSIFANLKNTKNYLAQVYANVPDPYSNRGGWGARDASFSQISDESNYFAESDFSITAFNYNTLSASFGAFEYLWPEYYKPVRTATDFINKIDGANSREVSPYLKAHFKAEARAMRAIFYFWLLRLYGPVVILPEPISISASNDELAHTRAPFDSCVNYITKQLDTAYLELKAISTPNQPTDLPLDDEYGRVTTGVCKAYKEQVLLLAASPLFNGNSAYSGIVNPDGTHLFPSNFDKNKWKKAADAAKDFIDEFVPGTYDIFTETDSDPYMAAYKACRDVISTDWNKEWIFGKAMSNGIGTYNYNAIPKFVGYGTNVNKGGGYLAVNQSMVDAYFTKNGRSITDPLSGYQNSGFTDFRSPYDIKDRKTFNQWINREPRFYAGVTYTNSYWLDQGSSADEVIVDFEYHGSSGKIQSDHDYSSTGYLIRKNITKGNDRRGWCHLRLAQIYLDYAEALNEYDPGNANILKYVNIIRKRAGIPIYGSGADMIEAPTGQNAVRQAIHHERQVELAFEAVRYFDQRRWLTAAIDLNKPVWGMNVDGDGDDFYKQKVIKNVSFTQRCYLWAIPSSEIRKDSKLTQNLGW
ncbi:MAG TPA: RagB/SusD family nutrient uptake outer membrane protein [Arachidicoccus sp.]|nr:RagB/SusD family nutrient uptake outer membrane protein [Arachidicoccus sp.]